MCAWRAAQASSYSEFNAGIAAHNRGDWDETIKDDDAALAAPDLLPGFRVPAHIDRGDAYAAKQQWSPAEADYAAVLQAKPENLEARILRAAVFREEKRYDAAIADFTQVIKIRPTLPMGYEGRAITYDEQGNLDAAIADYTTVIGFEPREPAFYVLRGSAWRRKGGFDMAIADQSKALELDGSLSRALFERAEAYMDKGDYDSAVSDSAQGVRLKPADLDGRMELGRAQWSAGQFSDAETTFAQLVTARPAFAYTAIWHALALAAEGKDYAQSFAGETASADKTKWPAPIVQLYLGQSTPAAVLAAAADPDAEKNKEQLCEANFYGGEWQLQHGQEAAARPMLAAAQQSCPLEFIERDAASAELARLGRRH
ncbi:MAG TPA: tetratricopeptide repeat protein [Rhizomicrobium sp.]|nr:tetratricopeptide repeat protein [Rhizomicrobium sp.]